VKFTVTLIDVFTDEIAEVEVESANVMMAKRDALGEYRILNPKKTMMAEKAVTGNGKVHYLYASVCNQAG
jgi:hypothetical protein